MPPPLPPSPPSGPPYSIYFSRRKLTAPGPPAPERTKILAWSRKCMAGDVGDHPPRVIPAILGTLVPRLVQSELAAAGGGDLGHPAPFALADRAALDALALQRRDGRIDVVAHQIELVEIVPLALVDPELGGREAEDEPAAARVDARHFEHVAEEFAVRLGV